MIIATALRLLVRLLFIVALVAIGTLPLFWPRETVRGVWQTDGYGLVFDIGRFEMNAYHLSAAGCLPYISAPSHSILLGEGAGLSFTETGDVLTLRVEETVNPIVATPLDALPADCLTPPDTTPQAVFDQAWTIMNEHYPFFDLHGVDWGSRRATLPDDATADDLWAALTAMLEGLDDGHTWVYRSDTDTGYSAATGVAWYDGILAFRDMQNANLTEVSDTGLAYRILPGNIGYVVLRHMDTRTGLLTAPDSVASAAFSDVSDALQGTKAIILDNRFNPGGSDPVSMAYASFFATQPTPAFSKTTRSSDGYTPPTDVVTQPVGTLTQPVYLLNSRFTASAAEIFTLALRELPNVTVVGDPTAGALSDIMDVRLGNGWVLGLSHQRYLDADGVQHEAAGIPPDETLPFDAAAMRGGTDPQLEALLERLQ